MNEDQPAIDDDDQPRSWKSALPMILAGTLMLALLAGVLIINLVNPAADRLTDSTQVQHRVNDMYSAMGTLNYEQYRASFCEPDVAAPTFPTSVQFADENRAANDADGKVVVPDMAVEVIGDTATVTAHWHREKTENNKQQTEFTLVKEGDEWKVCNR